MVHSKLTIKAHLQQLTTLMHDGRRSDHGADWGSNLHYGRKRIFADRDSHKRKASQPRLRILQTYCAEGQ